MKLSWLTDIHLNFLNDDEINSFLDKVDVSSPETILVGGDIGDSNSIAHSLKLLNERFKVPVYFVLGMLRMWQFNRNAVSRFSSSVDVQEYDTLRYLSNSIE